jgi:hypothetical protein
MDYLLQAGANIDQVDRYLGSVLMAVYEVEMDHGKKMDIVRFLISRGDHCHSRVDTNFLQFKMIQRNNGFTGASLTHFMVCRIVSLQVRTPTRKCDQKRWRGSPCHAKISSSWSCSS